MFPHFISTFIKKDDEVPLQTCEPIPRERRVVEEPCNNSMPKDNSEKQMDGVEASIMRSTPVAGTSSLRQLDLENLARDCGPPTELRNRKNKFAKYEKDCSKVGDGLFVGGEVVAKKRDILQSCKITHVINCVGMLYPAYFEDELKYQTLYLQDSPKEDILAVLYDVFDFIEGARRRGNVFVHCSQGVSRSMTLAIAYRMWKEKKQYEDVFAEVKEMRGVANPNIGFICQLMQWHKRRSEQNRLPNLYRIAPQSSSAPTYLVPKWVNGSESRGFCLDSRGSFVLHNDTTVYLWKGSRVLGEEFVEAAHRFIQQLEKYEMNENVPLETVIIEEGKDDDTFVKLLKQCLPKLTVPEHCPSACPEFDADYEFWMKARVPFKSSQDQLSNDACESARSGRKTPRVETHSFSPNDRLRKQARSDSFDDYYEDQRGNGHASRSIGSNQMSPSPHILGNARENSAGLLATDETDNGCQHSSSEEEVESSSDGSHGSKERNRESTFKRYVGIPKLNLG